MLRRALGAEVSLRHNASPRAKGRNEMTGLWRRQDLGYEAQRVGQDEAGKVLVKPKVY
ncbi:hypothetical protein E2C01_091838 [Portunus trituberculatus]|uniref:Uncharacterized protein n=1 Tax=Portunus trituberculatus TaxID=210409 RepID=A0A5B7JK32_PORTR|nr:hypothetical protein [Portunus trituberculatus]